MCMRSSRRLHNKMFHKILRAPPRFFDINPTGITSQTTTLLENFTFLFLGPILNRFSKDLGAMDEVLPNAMLDVTWVS